MDTQAGPSRWIPTLSYRTKSGDALSVKTGSSTGCSNTNLSTPATSPLYSDFCHSPRLSPSDTDTPASSGPPSISPSSLAPRTPKNPTKKRSSFFVGMFSVKEPSAQALIDYQKQLLKQGNGRITAVGLPGVSSAKLPPTVPKTNSKWDGVPQTMKEREKQQEMVNRQSLGGPSRTIPTAGSSNSDVRPASSSHSRKRHSRGTLGGSSAYSSSSHRLVDLYGWEKPCSSDSSLIVQKDFATERPSTSRTTSSSSAPPLQPDSKFPPHEISPPPRIIRTDIEQSLPLMSGALSLPEHSHSPALTPCEPSPVTPNALSPLVGITAPDSEKTLHESLDSVNVDRLSSADKVILVSAGANILGPPAARRRPKPTPNQSAEESGKIAELDLQLNSILKRDTTPLKGTPPRPALASYFGSPGSGSPGAPVRRNSTRDRLGLGMTLKNQASSPPWTAHGPGEGTAGGRDTTPTPEAGHSLRRKARMSLFKK